MKCTDNEWKHCRVEKMGCDGCYYNKKITLDDYLKKYHLTKKINEKDNVIIYEDEKIGHKICLWKNYESVSIEGINALTVEEMQLIIDKFKEMEE